MKTYEVKYSERSDPGAGVLMKDFSFPWLRKKCPRTEFRAVWNEQAFTFSFDVDDSDIVLAESDTPNQTVLGSDRVEIFLATAANLKKFYYGAEMDPLGNVYDYRAKYHREIDDEWSFSNLKFRTELREDGYSVRGRFSMEELRELDCLKEKEMIVGVYRAEFSHDPKNPDEIVENWISWVDPKRKRIDFHVPSSFGRFVLVR